MGTSDKFGWWNCVWVSRKMTRAGRCSSWTFSTCHGGTTLPRGSSVRQVALKGSPELKLERWLTVMCIRFIPLNNVLTKINILNPNFSAKHNVCMGIYSQAQFLWKLFFINYILLRDFSFYAIWIFSLLIIKASFTLT